MSSRAQLQEYVKTLKNEIRLLKKDNSEKSKRLIIGAQQIKRLQVKVNNANLNQRKWYHFF